MADAIELLRMARCPNTDCADGGYYGPHGEAIQCQWCAERELALSHASGQEAVAWFVQLDAPGYRDHGTKLGPFSKESEADGWTHRREDGIEWKKVPLYLAPTNPAEIGRKSVGNR